MSKKRPSSTSRALVISLSRSPNILKSQKNQTNKRNQTSKTRKNLNRLLRKK